MYDAGVLPGRRIDEHHLPAIGLGGSERAAVGYSPDTAQVHIQDKAQKYGNAADDRHQLQEDEGEQRAQSNCRFFSSRSTWATP
jgi:hypothetical protein